MEQQKHSELPPKNEHATYDNLVSGIKSLLGNTDYQSNLKGHHLEFTFSGNESDSSRIADLTSILDLSKIVYIPCEGEKVQKVEDNIITKHHTQTVVIDLQQIGLAEKIVSAPEKIKEHYMQLLKDYASKIKGITSSEASKLLNSIADIIGVQAKIVVSGASSDRKIG